MNPFAIRRRARLVAQLRQEIAEAKRPRIVGVDGSGELVATSPAPVYSLDLREPYPMVRRLSNEALTRLIEGESN